MTNPVTAGSGRKSGTAGAEPVNFPPRRGFRSPGGGWESPAFFSEILMKKSIESRLAALPSKVAQPLRHLAKIGQMREKDIKTVLDAGDLTGNHQTLVGFAAGAMGMQAQGIPVADTVSMVKLHGGRIRLDWTPRRWREEHDRLAKAETLRRLSEKNVYYDIVDYYKLLPDFPGYIIRNSRRLAIVGWHQRHCVASYHNKVVRGQCAFACVFVNHTRWTVELH